MTILSGRCIILLFRIWIGIRVDCRLLLSVECCDICCFVDVVELVSLNPLVILDDFDWIIHTCCTLCFHPYLILWKARIIPSRWAMTKLDLWYTSDTYFIIFLTSTTSWPFEITWVVSDVKVLIICTAYIWDASVYCIVSSECFLWQAILICNSCKVQSSDASSFESLNHVFQILNQLHCPWNWLLCYMWWRCNRHLPKVRSTRWSMRKEIALFIAGLRRKLTPHEACVELRSKSWSLENIFQAHGRCGTLEWLSKARSGRNNG